MSSATMLIRVRSRDGLERVTLESSASTVSNLQQAIEGQLQVPIGSQTLSTNKDLLVARGSDLASQYTDMRNPSASLDSIGVGHGSVVYLFYSGERVVAGPPTPLTPAGSFGKKMTMDELIARQMRIERQEKPHCASFSVDRNAADVFQRYVHENLAFAVKRGGLMYGTVNEEGEVAVAFIYEPPQDGSEENLLLLRSEDEERQVDTIATGLGMQKVGFIFTQTVSQHKRDYVMSNTEIRQAASLHSECGSSSWVTAVVKLEVNEEGEATVHFEAFQLSDQCVKLYKDGWFAEDLGDLDPKLSRMTKDVIVLRKDTRDVDNDFFLVPVKILDHQGNLTSTFPIENRSPPVTLQALGPHLDGNKHLPYVKRISDFHLLLLLSHYFDLNTDIPQLAEAVRHQSPISDGYQLIIESLATGY